MGDTNSRDWSNPKNSMTTKLLTRDVAEILGVSAARVGQLVAEKKLHPITVGIRWPVNVFDAGEVEGLAGKRANGEVERVRAAGRKAARKLGSR